MVYLVIISIALAVLAGLIASRDDILSGARELLGGLFDAVSSAWSTFLLIARAVVVIFALAGTLVGETYVRNEGSEAYNTWVVCCVLTAAVCAEFIYRLRYDNWD